MHTMAAIDRSFSAGYEQRDLLLQEIAELSRKIEQLTKERDAAVEDLKKNNKCRICKHKKENIQDCQHYSSCGLAYIHFEWRGIDE